MRPFRCEDGDIAVIIYDTPSCSDNIGRFVEVRGKPRFDDSYALYCWRIRPLNPEPLAIDEDGGVTREIVSWESRVIHPDAWLMPVRYQDESLTDPLSEQVFGEKMRDTCIEFKRDEWLSYLNHVSDWEYNRYLKFF